MVNRMILHGRLTRDPELRQTNSGIPVCGFTVAWSEKRGENEIKLFLPVTAWRGTADLVAKYFIKGQEIIVEGKLTQRDWTDNDGNRRTVIELQAEHVHFCGGKRSEAAPPPEPHEPFSELEDGDGELPF